jgi:hypothetical protein
VDEGGKYKRNYSFPLIFYEWTECDGLENSAGVWNVGGGAATGSSEQTMRCVREAKRVGEGSRDMPRRRLRPLCPLSSGMPIRWQAQHHAPRAGDDYASVYTVSRPLPFLPPQLFQLHEPNNSQDSDWTVRSSDPGKCNWFSCSPNRAVCLWSPPSRSVRMPAALSVVTKRPVPKIYHPPPSAAYMGKKKIPSLYLNQQHCLLRIYQADSGCHMRQSRVRFVLV